MNKLNRRLSYTKRELQANFNEEKQSLVIRGYAIIFEEPTQIYDPYDGLYQEIIKKEALDNTDLSDVFLLYNHDYGKILGHTRANLRLEKDDTGLFYEAELPNISYAKDIYALVEARNYLGRENEGSILDGNSFGFYSSDEVINGLREVKKIDLLDEISIVARPAYDLACSVVSNQRKKAIEKKGKDNMDKELLERIKILENL